MDAFLTHRKEFCPGLTEHFPEVFKFYTFQFGKGIYFFIHVQDVLFLKIALFRNVIKITEYLPFFFTQYSYYFIRRPDIIFSFYSFTVGILGGIETTLRRGHVPQHISKDIFYNVSIKFLPRGLICLNISHRKQRLVIEHFFKMGNEPVFVRRIPMESATKLIINTATPHTVKGFFDYFQGRGIGTALPPSKEKGIIMGSRKLGRRAKTTVNIVVIIP